MEVIIRTQDRKLLGLFENFFEVLHDGRKYTLSGMYHGGKMMVLGLFNNKETAIKELDRIQKIIIDFMNVPSGVKPVIEINEDYDAEV